MQKRMTLHRGHNTTRHRAFVLAATETDNLDTGNRALMRSVQTARRRPGRSSFIAWLHSQRRGSWRFSSRALDAQAGGYCSVSFTDRRLEATTLLSAANRQARHRLAGVT